MLIFDNFDIPEAQKLTKWFQKLSEKRNFIKLCKVFVDRLEVLYRNANEIQNQEMK